MYNSSELRWFFKEEDPGLAKWFAKQGLSFESVNARTDYYLLALDQDDLAPKLREGKLEIKHRIAAPEKRQLTPKVEGYFEEWSKWSFNLKNDQEGQDKLAAKIIGGKKYTTQWIEVYKKRMGMKLGKDGARNFKLFPLSERLDFGCQVEYTLVLVKDELWRTFNFEWFGDEVMDIPQSFLEELFAETSLKLEDSMGYGQFLRRFWKESSN